MTNVLKGSTLLRCRKYEVVAVNTSTELFDRAENQLINAGFTHKMKGGGVPKDTLDKLSELSMLRIRAEDNRIGLTPFTLVQQFGFEDRMIFSKQPITPHDLYEVAVCCQMLILDV